jgi:hypothetical protein
LNMGFSHFDDLMSFSFAPDTSHNHSLWLDGVTSNPGQEYDMDRLKGYNRTYREHEFRPSQRFDSRISDSLPKEYLPSTTGSCYHIYIEKKGKTKQFRKDCSLPHQQSHAASINPGTTSQSCSKRAQRSRSRDLVTPFRFINESRCERRWMRLNFGQNHAPITTDGLPP